MLIVGCGVRQIDYADGLSSTEIFVGFGKTLDCTVDPGASVKTRTLGAWTQPHGLGLGFHSGRYVCGSTECQVVIWPQSKIDAATMEEMAGSLETICFVA